MELHVALTLEAMFQVWIGPWSPRMKQVLESNGTRSRWLEMVRRELNLDETLLYESNRRSSR